MPSQPPLLEQSVFVTVWDDAWAALRDTRYYVKWAVQPFGRAIAYLAILLAVSAVVLTIYAALALRPFWHDARGWILETIPTVTMTSGQLSVQDDATFTFSDGQEFFIRVDTTDVVADVAIDPFYDFGVVVAQDGLLFRNGTTDQAIIYAEEEVADFVTDGAGIVSKVGRTLILTLVQLPFLLLLVFLGMALVFTFVASFLVYLFSGFRLPLLSLWSMAIYALTPTLLVEHVLFIFAPQALLIVPTLVFLTYFALAVSHYRRFLDMRQNMA